MAKLIKKFVTGSNKRPSHSKSEFGSLKTTSTDGSISRSLTGDRSSVVGITTDYDCDSPPHRDQGKSLETSPKTYAEKNCSQEVKLTTTGPNATPPQLLAEYSDPFDLKKQLQEEQLFGACVVPVNEDDYSVPYEVKKLLEDAVVVDHPLPSRRTHSTQQDANVSTSQNGTTHAKPYNTESQDSRPREDYDEPWEWSKQRMLLQAQLENIDPHCIPPDFLSQQTPTPQLKRTNVDESDDVVSKTPPCCESPDASRHTPSDVVTPSMPEDAESGSEDERYEERYEATQPNQHDSDYEEGYTHLTEDATATEQTVPVSSTANYEEPWDLSAKMHEIDEKLKAAAASEEQLSTVPHESDTRSQEGYEKPWDWKPHQKDDRPQEGYEKPWDWKPHQKDDRPIQEYEEPWHEKQKMLMSKAGVSPAAHAAKPQNRVPTGVGGGSKPESSKKKPQCTSISITSGTQKEDPRPPDDYNEPWDHKAPRPIPPSTRQAHAPIAKKPSKSVCHQQSPIKKVHKAESSSANSGSRQSVIKAVKVDPSLSLEKQGWYHRAISREHAESLLKLHKEGSYLVRVSESNTMDYSLSLKSAHSFMHMKIVNKSNRYILGQFSQPFDSIPRMIHHYSINKLPIKGAEHISLIHPVNHELL